MRGSKAKKLRRLAAKIATDNRGVQYVGGTARHTRFSARATYQRLKRGKK